DPVEDRQEEDEGRDLPEGERADVPLNEKLGQAALELGQAELPVEAPGLADRLPREEPERRSSGLLGPHQENIETPLRAEDLAHALDIGRKPVLDRPSRGLTDALERGPHESVVEDGLELSGDFLALRR